jgi:hypothetical protein
MRIFPSKRTAKRWGIGAGIVLGLLLLANGFMSWRVHSKFNAKIAEIRAEGAPASIADLKPEPVPAEENAAAHIDALEPRLDEFAKEQFRWEEKTPLGKAYCELEEGEPPTAEQVAAMRAILDQYADLEAQISAAAACPKYASTADFSLGFNAFLEKELSRITPIRAAARMVNWQATVLIADGRPDLAVQRWLEMLRLAKLFEAEPTLVAQQVAFAVRYVTIDGMYRALSAGAIPDELRARLDRELARQENPAKISEMLASERAFSVSAALEQTSGQCGPEGCEPAPRVLIWLFGWAPKQFYIGPFDLYQEILPVADRPWPETKQLFSKGGEGGEKTGHGVLADLLMPAIESGIVSAHRDTALVRSLRVFNALQQFAAQNGREASGLEELDLPEEATVDPFSGEPLIVKRAGDDWLVYSVGENGKDDGGKLEKREDVGVGPVKKRAG